MAYPRLCFAEIVYKRVRTSAKYVIYREMTDAGPDLMVERVGLEYLSGYVDGATGLRSAELKLVNGMPRDLQRVWSRRYEFRRLNEDTLRQAFEANEILATYPYLLEAREE
jgi:hypothetical protein